MLVLDFCLGKLSVSLSQPLCLCFCLSLYPHPHPLTPFRSEGHTPTLPAVRGLLQGAPSPTYVEIVSAEDSHLTQCPPFWGESTYS